MRCIFCKTDSSNSISVEHIIPESLGNKEHVLPSGIVCDKCNNYFARKVEQPLLGDDYFLYARFSNLIPSKRGKIPTVKAFHPLSKSLLDIQATQNGINIYLDKSNIERFTSTSIEKNNHGNLYIPVPHKSESEYIFSRFLGKVAIEALASKALNYPPALEIDIVDNKGLDELRNYTRYGSSKIIWSFHQREIYPAEALFYSEEDGEYYDIPHEFTLLYTEEKELFFVIAIFGIEYVIDMSTSDISGYNNWLSKNNNKSPLYMNGIKFVSNRNMIAGLEKGSIIEVYERS